MELFRVRSLRFPFRRSRILLATLAVGISSDGLQAEEFVRLPAPVTLRFEPEGRGFVHFRGLFSPANEPPTRTTLADEELSPDEAAWTTCTTYSPDGRTLAVGDGPWMPDCRFPPSQSVNENGGLIRLVDTKTNHVIRTLPPGKLPGHEYQVSHLEYSSDGKTLFSMGEDRSYANGKPLCVSNLTAWDPETGRVRIQVVRPNEFFWFVAAVSPDGRAAATAGKDGMVRIWDVEKGLERIALRAPGAGVREENRVSRLAFSPGGSDLIAGAADGDLRFWEARSGRELVHLAGPERDGHRFSVEDLAFQPDGRTLACFRDRLDDEAESSVKHNSEIAIVDAHDRREVAKILADPGMGFTGFAGSPDGKMMAIGCILVTDQEEEPRGWVRLWDKATQKTRDIGMKDLRYPSKLLFSPDGRVLAVTDEPFPGPRESVVLLEVGNGKKLTNLIARGSWNPLDLAFSPDGRTLASTGFSLKIWDLRALGLAVGPPQ